MVSRGMQSAGAWLVVVLASFVVLPAEPAVAADKGAAGYWKSIDKETGKVQGVFRLWEDKGKLVGKILKSYPKAGKKAQETCTECAGAQKDKPVVGLIFFWGFSHDEENPRKWVDGKVLNPEDGNVYNAEATLSEDGQSLDVYGYIRVLVKLGGTSTWTRISATEAQGL